MRKAIAFKLSGLAFSSPALAERKAATLLILAKLFKPQRGFATRSESIHRDTNPFGLELHTHERQTKYGSDLASSQAQANRQKC